ncbi:MAG: response regulator [Anaerolineales bacterium]|nr:response regulator [Anaerolineales bacterium]
MKSTEHETVKNTYQPDILIIDDDPTMSRILSMVLIKAGYTVRSATTARNGLNDALRKTPDAILLDYMLPDRSGLELLVDFRNSIDLENVPVIMLTASSETSIVRTAIVGGVNDYLLKPVEPETLLNRLESLLGNRALSQLNQEENLKVEKEEVKEPLEDQEGSADPEKYAPDQTAE